MANDLKVFNVPNRTSRALMALSKEKRRSQQLNARVKMQEQVIGALKSKANYVDIILNNKGLVTITQIAKDYGMSGRKMNQLLHNYKIQYKQSGQWFLYSKYQNRGYTHSYTIGITRRDGAHDIKMATKWTQKGRLFIYELLKKDTILPTIEQSSHEIA